MQRKIIISTLLLVATMALFARGAGNGFINFDDPGYVYKNPMVKGGISAAGVAWAFTSTAMSNWHPLTWLSHMADVSIFGLSPAGHHLTSIAIHAITVVLLFLLLEGITGAVWRSMAVAALFAVHPLHVESVVWVAERKDVLSSFFWVVTLIFYAAYVRKARYRFYLLSLLSFVLGLMSKPMLVTLPLVMLLMDLWPFNRYVGEGPLRKRLFVLISEKIPFFAFSLVSAVITMYGQHKGGAMATLVKVPLLPRIENALVSYVKYIWLMFWPHNLAILYPFPKSTPLWQVAVAAVLLLLASLAVIRFGRRFPYLVTGWFWYLVTLVPVIGIVQVGGQAMADRYTYIPLTGLFIVCCWLLPDLLDGYRHRKEALVICALLVFAALSIVTWRQIGYWKDDVTLYRHTLAVTRDNYLIMNNLGIALDEKGDLAGAYGMFKETLRINPGSATAYNNLGALAVRWGNYGDAMDNFAMAIEIVPDYALSHAGMGKALAGMGRYAEAIGEYKKTLALDPSLAETHLNLAILLMKTGRIAEAEEHYEYARRLEPNSPKAPINMGVELASLGRMVEAVAYFDRALAIEPDSVEAHFNRGVALAKLGRREEATAEFSRVLTLMPGADAARNWLEKLRQGG